MAINRSKNARKSKELKDAGLKITLPRIKILQVLENSSVQHVSAEDVYKMLIAADEEIGLATVYRVLTQFEQAGLVASIILKADIRSLNYPRKTIMTTLFVRNAGR